MPDNFLDEIAATMSLMEEPVAYHDPESGTSSVVDLNSGNSVDNIESENLDEYLEYARYGSNVQHGVLRHMRDFTVQNGNLILSPWRR